jgi:hypothetical protein
MIIVGDATGIEVTEMAPTMQSWIDLIGHSITLGHHTTQQGTIVKTKQGMYRHLRTATRGGRPTKVQRKKRNQDREAGRLRRREARPAGRPPGEFSTLHLNTF